MSRLSFSLRSTPGIYLELLRSHMNSLPADSIIISSAIPNGTPDVGDHVIEIELTVSPDRRWLLNGKESPEVAGCIDLDLNFSPSPNLLPIRRLDLAVGQEMEVRVAWLGFPSFILEPLVQRYRRIDEISYRYESAGGSFVTELRVNAEGFVTKYPNIWEAEVGV